MSSKSEILANVRKHSPPLVALPELNADWIIYPDRIAQFCDVLKFVGGVSEIIDQRSAAQKVIESIPCFKSAKQIVCTAPDVTLGNVDLNQISDPHDLADVDLAIVEGEVGVAENAAVWIDGVKLKHRVVLFLAQHVVLILDVKKILNNMHEAYDKIQFTAPGYGVFVSGPSKTADIEQSLVIGAHGARSLTVLLIHH